MRTTLQQRKALHNLYYITHTNNLPSILQRGILSHDLIEKLEIPFTRIYDSDIVSNRKEKTVADGRSLWQFANLYFQPRNPMLYRVVKEKGAQNIAVVGVRLDVLNRGDIFITDGNAASRNTTFYPAAQSKEIIRNIANEIMDIEYWNDVDSSKRRIMAECLVPGMITPDCIESIYVDSHQRVEQLGPLLRNPRVSIIPERRMFFQPIKELPLTSMLSLIVEGDMFFSGMQTITVSVNTVKVMGKGLASRAKYQFPDVYVYYQDLCRKGKLRMGTPAIYNREGSVELQLADDPGTMKQNEGETKFLLFPTKRHWRNKSDIEGIEKGMRWLVDNYKKEGITSLALPALGCGLGKLDWKDVGPILCKYLTMMDIPTRVYLPAEKKIRNEYLMKTFLLPESTKNKGKQAFLGSK